MPLVRLSGNDGLGFDVAKMTDNVRSNNNSSTRNSNNSRHHGKTNNNNFSPTTPDTFDDLTSLDTSSGRQASDEISTSRGSFHAGGARRRGSNSNMSIGSTSNNAYHNYNSPLNGDGSDNINDSYEKLQSSYMDNLDELQNDNNDPRKNNPSFNPGRHNSLVTVGTGWSPNDYIPEEDETSLSTLDEESVTPSSNNNHSSSYTSSNNYQNSSQHVQYHHQQPPHNRLSHRQQKSESDDDGSISTNQSFKHKTSRDSFNNNYRRGNSRESEKSQRIISQQQQLISQLESQVMKLNLELATTKSSLDEIQLQNRKINDDKSNLNSKIREVQEENDELHIIIERLEKEKILRNMDGTRGTIVATTNTNDGGGGRNSRRLTGSSCVVWDGASVSGNTWADTYTVTQQKLGKVGAVGGGGLEVPFRTAKPRRSSVSSFSTVGDDTSRGDIDSVALSSCDNSNDERYKLENSCADSTGGVLLTADDEEEENMSTSQRSQGLNLLGMFGGGKKNKQNQKQQPTEEITKQMEETFVSSLSPVHSKGDTYTDDDDDDNLESSFSNQRSQSQSGEVEIGSNPQGETFNDDDPFSTWSAPGDPKRKKQEPEQNWLQRGLKGGGRGGGRNSSQQSSSSQSKDEIEDPFDVCNGNVEENNDTEMYTSFAATHSSEWDASDKANDDANGKRFGLFKGFGKKR